MASESCATAPPPQAFAPPIGAWLGESRTLGAGAIALGASLLLPAALLQVNNSYVLPVAIVLAAGGAVVALEESSVRRVALALLVWGLVLRVLVLTLCFGWAVADGGPFLGPDSTEYFEASRELASRNLQLDTLPVIYYGSYDIGQYYLFAAAVRYLHADLFGLQMLNCALTALAAQFAYGMARALVPRGALWIGIVVALHPSLIGLASIDLLKDPSILCGVVGLLWALLRLVHADKAAPAAGAAVVALICAMYLRTSRFYSFSYIEIGFVAALLLRTLRGRPWPFRSSLAFALTVFVFVIVEVLPTRARWPLSPTMVITMASYTIDTPALRAYAPGLFDRLQTAGRRGAAGRAVSEQGEDRQLGSVLLTLPANMFRRVFGPFPWILPSDWHFKSLQAGQYYLFPGMLIWYGALPFVVIGIGLTGCRLWRPQEDSFGIVMLWCYVALYFAQYLAINLSYRQRDVMLPVLLVFAWIGYESMLPGRAAQRWYVGYWTGLASIAVLHLIARAVTGG